MCGGFCILIFSIYTLIREFNASASDIAAIDRSRKTTSIWLKSKITIASNINVAITLGMNIFFPNKIHNAIIISNKPKACKSIASGTIPKRNEGKYPIQVYGLNIAEIAGYMNANATPTLSNNSV